MPFLCPFPTNPQGGDGPQVREEEGWGVVGGRTLPGPPHLPTSWAESLGGQTVEAPVMLE